MYNFKITKYIKNGNEVTIERLSKKEKLEIRKNEISILKKKLTMKPLTINIEKLCNLTKIKS